MKYVIFILEPHSFFLFFFCIYSCLYVLVSLKKNSKQMLDFGPRLEEYARPSFIMKYYIWIGRTGAENIGSESSEGLPKAGWYFWFFFLIFSQVNFFFFFLKREQQFYLWLNISQIEIQSLHSRRRWVFNPKNIIKANWNKEYCATEFASQQPWLT